MFDTLQWWEINYFVPSDHKIKELGKVSFTLGQFLELKASHIFCFEPIISNFRLWDLAVFIHSDNSVYAHGTLPRKQKAHFSGNSHTTILI